MGSQKEKLYLLGEEKVSKALIKLGVPMMIGMMVSALYNLVDAYFVGRLGTPQMGAVSVAYPLGVIILGVGLLFGSGASSYLARLLGDKQYNKANECASTAVFTSTGIGILLIMGMLLFLEPILRILGATDTIMPYAKEYSVIFIVGLLLNIFNITVNNTITSEGAAMISMSAMLAGGLANIILDPICINVLNMGVRGAAIATLISRCITTVMYLHYMYSGKSIYHFQFKYFKPSRALYMEIFKIGIPMLVYQLLMSLSMSITNLFAAKYSDSVIAATGIVSRIMSLGCMIIFGFLKGYQPFVGFNYGAGKMNRVKNSTQLVLIWSTVFGMVYSGILLICMHPIMNAFSKNDLVVIDVGSKALILNAIVFIVFGFQAVYSSYFLALGKAKEGGLISIGRQGIFFIPIIVILTTLFDVNGIIFAQPVADLCSLVLVIILKKKNENLGKAVIRLENV